VQNNAGAMVTGRVDNMTLTDLDISGGNTVAGDGIYLYDQTDATGQTNITFSGLDFSGTGRYGVYLRGNALNTLASVDNTSTNVNTITGSATSAYNLLLDGIKGGDYDYITLSTATASSLYFTNDAAPTNWALDSGSGGGITLNEAPSPATFAGMTIPANFSYTAGTNLIEDYVRLVGSILSNMTIGADPLANGRSVWYVTSSVTIPGGTTLTVTDDAILKFGDNINMEVSGSLVVNATTGNEAIFTSINNDVLFDTN
ncbi:MAG: hypothetical protein GY732_17590, partial [Gammaproteobacteria bacterium]|nr:hypothetical protein [Gammaproteobacteria bacterium]